MTDAYEVGKGKPPRATRFKPGQSGNPRGRPKGQHRGAPYDTVLGKLVTIRDNGVERKVTAAEAFLLQLAKRGLEGNSVAARVAVTAVAEARQRLIATETKTYVYWHKIVSPGSVVDALAILKIAEIRDPYAENARVLLKPWLVEAALRRLEVGTLAPEQIEKVRLVTSKPDKVNWRTDTEG